MKISELLEAMPSRRAPVSREWFIENQNRFCQAITNYQYGRIIYRGVSKNIVADIYQVDPKVYPESESTPASRRSRNTLNIYTLFVDNDPSWEAYPNRSQSLICISDYQSAAGYGRPYAVLFENNSEIGLCPSNDWWDSFQSMSVELNRYREGRKSVYDMSSLNQTIATSFEELTGREIDDTSWTGLSQDFAEMDRIIQSHTWDELSARQGYIRAGCIVKYLKSTEQTMEEGLRTLLNPTRNGFEVKSLREPYSASYRREIWGSGRAVMIMEPVLRQILNP